MTKEQAYQYKNDHEMIANPDWWPNFPLLPVKNPREKENGWPMMGCIYACKPTQVFLCNMFAFDSNAPTRQFNSIQDLLAAGWIVD